MAGSKQKVTPCLWYDGDAEEAAAFYVTLLPDSRIDKVVRAPADNPSMKKGGALLVEFTLAGQKYSGLNGGPQFRFTEAVSFMVHCEDQEEVDRLWNAILDNGGEASACGWIKDRWGLAWQITPQRLLDMLASEDREAAQRAMEKMMEMVKLDIAEIEAAYRGDSAAA
jgi:predicted 3-demethylubiquinone-9 3-methyltransferase (glyoxalase superfamily)